MASRFRWRNRLPDEIVRSTCLKSSGSCRQSVECPGEIRVELDFHPSAARIWSSVSPSTLPVTTSSIRRTPSWTCSETESVSTTLSKNLRANSSLSSAGSSRTCCASSLVNMMKVLGGSVRIGNRFLTCVSVQGLSASYARSSRFCGYFKNTRCWPLMAASSARLGTSKYSRRPKQNSSGYLFAPCPSLMRFLKEGRAP